MRKRLFFVAPWLVIQPALAQQAEPPTGEDTITVLASGVRQDLQNTGQSISVFDREAIVGSQGPDLVRLLERAPGVTADRNGPPGAFTAVHVRGAESEQLLVLVDGVRVADPASPGGGFDLGNLLTGNIAKVELQRGANSTIWGSQALGGVLAVTTGGGGEILSGSAEYGAHDSVYATLATRLTVGPATLEGGVSHFASDGFSAAAAGSEPDGFRQSELTGRVTAQVAGNLRAFALGRYADGQLDLDGFPAPDFTLADTAEFQETRQRSGAIGLAYDTARFALTLTASAAETQRQNFDPEVGSAPTFTADGLSRRAELRGRWQVERSIALDFGAEHEVTRFTTLFDARQETALTGAYAQLDYTRGRLHLAAGLRRDEHRDFGGQWSVGADAAYALSPRWRLTASYGEGFKAPTLFQLHSDFGNPRLRAETSRNYDAAVAYRGRHADARLTAFRRDARDLIAFVSCFGISGGICAGRPFGTYDNAARAKVQGVEVEAGVRPIEALRLAGAYTYLEAQDRSPGAPNAGKALARRPRHALTLAGDAALGRARIGADLRIVSDSFDDAANTVPLEGFIVLTFRGEMDLGRALTLFGRIENAFDENYQTAAGYLTAGRSAYLGARAKL